METLNARSKIVARWTTNPADLGYDGRKSNWQLAGGDVMGVRRALNYDYELGQLVGPGTYRALKFFHRGVEVSRDEIADAVNNMEWEKERRKY